jgi:hypothetical protein
MQRWTSACAMGRLYDSQRRSLLNNAVEASGCAPCWPLSSSLNGLSKTLVALSQGTICDRYKCVHHALIHQTISNPIRWVRSAEYAVMRSSSCYFRVV